MSLNDTPRADRLHIGLFGKRNSGKSSLINALTGQDIAKQLQGRVTGRRVLLTVHMLRHGETVFLDDYTVARLADELGCPVQIVGIDGGDLLDAMLDASSTVS